MLWNQRYKSDGSSSLPYTAYLYYSNTGTEVFVFVVPHWSLTTDHWRTDSPHLHVHLARLELNSWGPVIRSIFLEAFLLLLLSLLITFFNPSFGRICQLAIMKSSALRQPTIPRDWNATRWRRNSCSSAASISSLKTLKACNRDGTSARVSKALWVGSCIAGCCFIRDSFRISNFSSVWLGVP